MIKISLTFVLNLASQPTRDNNKVIKSMYNDFLDRWVLCRIKLYYLIIIYMHSLIIIYQHFRLQNN